MWVPFPEPPFISLYVAPEVKPEAAMDEAVIVV